MKRVLVVCTANKTRSVIAMEVANSIAQKGKRDYHFDSAGIAVVGNQVDVSAVKLLLAHGIITSHTPTHVEKYSISEYDEIHVMTDRHKKALISFYKNIPIADKITVLDVEDPYQKGKDSYEECFTKIEAFYNDYFDRNF